jgi:hypothetical protein
MHGLIPGRCSEHLARCPRGGQLVSDRSKMRLHPWRRLVCMVSVQQYVRADATSSMSSAQFWCCFAVPEPSMPSSVVLIWGLRLATSPQVHPLSALQIRTGKDKVVVYSHAQCADACPLSCMRDDLWLMPGIIDKSYLHVALIRGQMSLGRHCQHLNRPLWRAEWRPRWLPATWGESVKTWTGPVVVSQVRIHATYADRNTSVQPRAREPKQNPYF